MWLDVTKLAVDPARAIKNKMSAVKPSKKWGSDKHKGGKAKSHQGVKEGEETGESKKGWL